MRRNLVEMPLAIAVVVESIKNVVSKNNCLMLCNYYDDNKPQIMRYKPLEIGLNKLRHYIYPENSKGASNSLVP